LQAARRSAINHIVGARYEEYSSSEFSGWAAYERINIPKHTLGKALGKGKIKKLKNTFIS
jgi:hypothetical protein